jgi:cytochrome c oxidase subunit 2
MWCSKHGVLSGALLSQWRITCSKKRGRLTVINPATSRYRQVLRWAALAAVLSATALLLSGCSLVPFTPQTTLTPHSDVGQRTQDVFAITVWIAVAIGVLIEGALIVTIFRFRRRPGQAVGAPVGRHGSTPIEIIWTAVPALVLVFLGILVVPLIFDTAAAAPRNAVQVRVIGHQWWWEFRYMQGKKVLFTTANELHLPNGRAANFDITSADVIHSFWIPTMFGKRDALPNHTNNVWFTPKNTNPQATVTYPGQCAEFCGQAHSFMYLNAIVEPEAAYDAWVQHQESKAVTVSASAPAEVRRGEQVVTQGSCAGCHTIDGTAAAGQIGPNLTHIGSRANLSGPLLAANTPANLAKWIHDSSYYKPGSHMPPQNLSKSDLAAAVAYLESLK